MQANELIKNFYKKGARNSIISLFVIGTVWGVLVSLLGEGTMLTIVNIVFFLISIFIGVGIQTNLKGFLNSTLAWIISMSILAIVILFYRSLIVSLL